MQELVPRQEPKMPVQQTLMDVLDGHVIGSMIYSKLNQEARGNLRLINKAGYAFIKYHTKKAKTRKKLPPVPVFMDDWPMLAELELSFVEIDCLTVLPANLTKLTLNRCANLRVCTAALHNLQDLCIGECPRLDPISFVEQFPQLTKLFFIDRGEQSYSGRKWSLSRSNCAATLCELWLLYETCDEFVVPDLPRLTSVTTLVLSAYEDVFYFRPFPKLPPNLKCFDLWNHSPVCGNLQLDVHCLNKLPHLKTLFLGNDVEWKTPPCIDSVGMLTALQELTIVWAKVFDGFASVFSELKQLTYLKLEGSDMYDSENVVLPSVCDLANLRHLSLDCIDCDQGLPLRMTRLRHLRTLDLEVSNYSRGQGSSWDILTRVPRGRTLFFEKNYLIFNALASLKTLILHDFDEMDSNALALELQSRGVEIRAANSEDGEDSEDSEDYSEDESL